MFPVINPMYLQVFLEFRTQHSQEIYSRESLSLLQVLLSREGGEITSICGVGKWVHENDVRMKDIFEIVETATKECLTTGSPLVLPESLQWRYEFALFFTLLFTKYGGERFIGSEDRVGNFQRILWELMRFPPEKLDYYNWDSLCAGRGWNIVMLHQALDSISKGSWIEGDDWSWGLFLVDGLEEAKALIKAYGTWWGARSNITESLIKKEPLYYFQNIMEKQCEQIRLGVTLTSLKSLNYPMGA